MLRKPNRLRERSRFQEVRRKGRTLAHPLMVLVVMPNGLSESRFGFTVSRRIGGAVVRNRVKRLMREAVRLRLPTIVPGYDIVLIARQPIREASFADVDHALERLLSRAELLKTPSFQRMSPEDVP